MDPAERVRILGANGATLDSVRDFVLNDVMAGVCGLNVLHGVLAAVQGLVSGASNPHLGQDGERLLSSIADRLVEQVHRNQLSEKNLKAIAKSSWSKLKKEQDRARALRDLLVSTRTDEELDMHFTNFAKPEVIELINEIGDIEKPVPLGLALLKKVPAFRKLALQAGVKLLFT